MIVTTTYECPDLDGYGSSVAYAELLRAQGKDAMPLIFGEPHVEVQWIVRTFDIQTKFASCSNLGNLEIVLLDASDPAYLCGNIKPEQVIEVIDHRKLNKASKFSNANIQIETVGAAATLVAEKFEEAGVEPLRESALLLCGGIISNTQNFTAVATDRDRKAFEWLSKFADMPDNFVNSMFLAKSDLSGGRLYKTLIGDSKVLVIRGKVVGTAQLEIIGAENLIGNRCNEIEETARKIKSENNTDYMFANIKDLSLGESYILCVDDQTAELLSQMDGVEWSGRIGRSKVMTMRKQITSWIDEKLSRS